MSATSAGLRSGSPRRPGRGPGRGRPASVAAASSGVGLPSRRSSPTGLPVAVLVAEHAEHVVAQLEGLAQRVAVGREHLPQLARARRPGRRRRGAAARSCTCRTCSGRCGGPTRGRCRRRAVPRRSRYWPMFSSMRSSSHTGAAVGRRAGDELVGVHVGQVADEDGDALAEAPGLAPPVGPLVVVAEGEVGGADARGGWRSRPSRRRARGRRPGAARRRRRRRPRGGRRDRRPAPTVAPVAEGRPQPLAAAHDERPQRREGRREVGARRSPSAPSRRRGARRGGPRPRGRP